MEYRCRKICRNAGNSMDRSIRKRACHGVCGYRCIIRDRKERR